MSKETKVIVVSGYVRFDDMTWPRAGARADEINHTLRYGNPSRCDILVAAGIVSAYQALIYKPAKERNRIISILRKAEESDYAKVGT